MKACRAYSIRRKLFVRISLVIAAAFVVFVAALVVEFRFKANQAEERSVVETATQLRLYPERYTFSGFNPGDAPGPRIAIDGISVARLDGTMVVPPTRWRSDTFLTPPFEHIDKGVVLGRDQDTGEQLFSLAFLIDGARLGLPDAQYVMQISRPTSNFDPIIRSFIQLNIDESWWIFALLILATAYITKRTIDGAIRSVSDAAEVADSISTERLDVRLPMENLPTEVLPLAAKTNDALDRLEEIIQAERSFTASAAHELRTPLAVLRSKLEDLADGDHKDDVLGRVDTLTRIVGQLLQLARIEQWQPSRDSVAEAADVARGVVSAFSPRAVLDGGDVSFDVAADAGPWPVDRVLLEVMLVNLLENALKHGASPPAMAVRIDRHGLCVDDNGPGIPEADRPHVATLFWRADRARRDGVGIGLALVARIAEKTGGRVIVGTSPLGGCRIRFMKDADAPLPDDDAETIERAAAE